MCVCVCVCFTATVFGSLLLRPPYGYTTTSGTHLSDQAAASSSAAASRPREESRKRANFVLHFIANDYDD